MALINPASLARLESYLNFSTGPYRVAVDLRRARTKSAEAIFGPCGSTAAEEVGEAVIHQGAHKLDEGGAEARGAAEEFGHLGAPGLSRVVEPRRRRGRRRRPALATRGQGPRAV
mmetsp:Transcript_25009/g.77940  ORF Transcript_25009/g.77940 Transcript_25009/m.77940 type:complete len:115 (+) Transcript_25009:1014-1358(+)